MNASSTQEVPKELRELMDIICEKPTDGELTREIEEMVTKAKAVEEWRREYMTWDIAMAEAKEEGREEGRERTALLMLAEHEPMEKIVRYSGLPLEKVEGLKEQTLHQIS